MKKYLSKTKILLIIAFFIYLGVFATLYFLQTRNITLIFNGGDALNQHITFLDNMRLNYAETGELFPQLNMNLGLMSSFANYIYHWTFNTWTYLSYIFPGSTLTFFINILAMSYAMFFFFTAKLLEYYTKNFKNIIITSLVIAGSAVFLAYYSIHIIIILGLPFVPLILIGAHRMLVEKKSTVFIIGFVLVITTSFNILLTVGFSSLAYIFILNYKMYDKPLSFKELSLKLLRNYVVIILLSSIIMLPLLLRSMNMARSAFAPDDIPLIEKIINFDLLADLTFSWVAIGLASIGIISLIYNLIKKDKTYFYIALMILIFFICPRFSYLFNFLQYQASKAYMPLLPFFAILLLNLFESDGKLKVIISILTTCLVIVFLPYIHSINPAFKPYYTISLMTITCLIALVLILYYSPKRFYSSLFIALAFLIANNSLYVIPSKTSFFHKKALSHNYKDEFYEQNANNLLSYKTKRYNIIESMYTFSPTAYSSINAPEYKEFFTNILPIEKSTDLNRLTYHGNTIYDIIFGISNSKYPTLAYPKIRGVYDTYNQQDLAKLPTLEKSLAFLKGNFTKDGRLDYENSLKIYDKPNITITNNDQTKKKAKVDNFNLDIPKNKKGVLLLEFKVDSNSCNKEVNIHINRHINKRQTCDSKFYNENNVFKYIIDIEPKTPLVMQTYPGTFDLTDIKYSFIEYQDITKLMYDYVQPEDVDIDLNDSITTSLKMKKDGYLITTIPYDKGFTLKVDNKTTEIEKVNNNFIGAKLSKGDHTIELSYQIPGFALAQKLVLVGIVCFGIIVYREKKRS